MAIIKEASMMSIGRLPGLLSALFVTAIAVCCGGRAPAASEGEVGALTAGNHEISLRFKDRDRLCVVHVPPQAEAGKPLPLVINFHGGAGDGAGQQHYTGMDRAADRYGFIVAYPYGTGRSQRRLLTWNSGWCCGYAKTHEVDDVGFVLALLDHINRSLPFDRSRVYATGLSNGAMMAYRMAVEASDKIAAIAPVAGAMLLENFAPTRAMPIMHIHSVSDPRALYQGGLGPAFPLTNSRVNHSGVEAMLSKWIDYDGCAKEPIIEQTIEGRKGASWEHHTATKYVYGGGRDGVEVVLWKLTGAGHVWPGGLQDYLTRLLGPATQIIDANTEMWRFFERFALPTRPLEPH